MRRRDGVIAADDVPGLAEGFHRMHERIYTIKNENDLVEFTTWKVRAIGPAAAELAAAEGTATAGAAEPHGTRQVHLPEPRCAGNDTGLSRQRPRVRVPRSQGPAIVEEATTTVLVPEDAGAVIDALGNYRVTLQ